MPESFRAQTIANWVGDFADSSAFQPLPAPAKEYAGEILPAFLNHACSHRDIEPGDIEEADIKSALLDGVGALMLPGSVRAVAPDLCAAFLADLQNQGRLADGAALGRYLRALRSAYDERTADSAKTVRNPGERIGRNTPCPCGSGKKFKNCCMR